MATVSFSITNTDEGSNWSGSFTVTTPSSPIATQIPTSVNSTLLNFNVAQFASFNEYATWRSVNISSQPSGPPSFLNIYPTTGYSIDIWCPSLIIDIGANRSWNFLNGKTYSLNPNKNTLIYNYNNTTAVYYAKNGQITFSVA
jgi:hypothetical protein